MIRKTVLALLLLLLLCTMAAQEKVSVLKAMALSAVLPGAGDLYMGNYQKGAAFLSAEVIIWLAYLRLDQERDWAIESYQDYADAYAGVPKGQDDDYYQRIQNYYSSEEYNDDVIRDARNYYLIYNNDQEAYQEYLSNYLIPEEEAWQWENDSRWSEYKKRRNRKQDMEIYSNFALGAAILNRVVSVIATTASARKHNRAVRMLKNVSIEPDLQNNGIRLNYAIHF